MSKTQEQTKEQYLPPSFNHTIRPVKQRFKLDDSTRQEIFQGQPQFGFNGLGEVVFRRTYSRDNESWHDVVIRVIEGVMSIRKEHFYRSSLHWDDNEWQDFAKDMALSLFKMEWMPPGRGLWMMGTEFAYTRGSTALNNCFRKDTRFWTSNGVKSFEDFKNGDAVMIRGQNKWLSAKVVSFGVQKLWELKVQKKNITESIFTTAEHRWLAKCKKGSKSYNFKVKNTNELEPGWKLQRYAKRTNFNHLEVCPIGIQHGIVFGDGAYNNNSNACQIQLCGDKCSLSKYFFTKRSEGKCITGLPNNWKQLPSLNMNKDYLMGFMAGVFATDGTIDKSSRMTITNSDFDTIEWYRTALFKLDILTGPVKISRVLSPYTGQESPSYRIHIQRENVPLKFFLREKQLERFTPSKEKLYWRVVSVEETNMEEEVWCIVEPENEEFTLENGIVTKNCAATDTKDDLVLSAEWTMDGLMNGVGVGFTTHWRGNATMPDKSDTESFVIPDSREGWVHSLIKLMCAYIDSPRHGKNKFPVFDYSQIRKSGEPIKGFGGLASGPDPLKKMHTRIEGYLDNFCQGYILVGAGTKEDPVRQKQYSHTRLVADIFNSIGACVVAGNVRRSAEICLGDVEDDDFINLKNYDQNPERGEIGWMSNNSVVLHADHDYEDFSYIPEMASRIRDNGEPGMINLYNIQKYGRYGKEMKDEATLVNPCGEIALN